MKKIRILAILTALLIAAGLYVVLQKADQQEIPTVKVAIALNDIGQNTILTEEMIQIKAIPEEMVLANTYGNKEALVGMIANADIKAGEQIISDRVSAIGDRSGASLAMLIEEGKRAITIAVDNVTGLSNMLCPGDMVDVIGHVEQPKGEEETEMVSVTIVGNVPVLAVDNVMSSRGKSEGYAAVTVMVTPEEANAIDFASNEGMLRVVLRTPLDEQKANANKITSDEVGID